MKQMSERPQLIDIDTFRSLARPTSAHLDEEEVNAYIRECEDKYIVQPLGWPYFRAAIGLIPWEEVCDASFEADTFLDGGQWTETSEDGKQIPHYCNGLKRALAYFVYARMVRADGAILSRSGNMRHNDQYADHHSDPSRNIYEDVMAMGEAYLAEAILYFNDHRLEASDEAKPIRSSRIHIHAIG